MVARLHSGTNKSGLNWESRKVMKQFNKLALANPLLKTTITRLVGRVLVRHFSPLGATAENPENTI